MPTDIRFSREDLLPALAATAGLAGRKNVLPGTSNILFGAERGVLRLTGSDMETEVSVDTSIPADAGFAPITLPAKKLLDILRNLPERSEVVLKMGGDGKCALRSGGSKFTLATLPAETFPLMSLDEIRPMGSCDASAFREALLTVEHAAPSGDARMFLNGVYFELTGDVMRLVATDSHRLAASELPFAPEEYSSECVGILPKKSVGEITRALSGATGSARISWADRAFVLESGKLQFATRLIDARYPEYQRVIPVASPYRLSFDREELALALRQAEVMADGKEHIVRLDMADESVMLKVTGEVNDMAEVEVPCVYNGPRMVIALNIHYLLDAVAVMGGERLDMGIRDFGNGVLITGLGNFPLAVVMPVRS
ncbi:DNA polymerase III, beta subunit (modular protein) [Acidithiobacillus ferrivorans]|uniref:Beta sliding clamp n=1 Tax=Acidithiobacillus ferrivorans TaxID=160808 RepID=A0A060UPT5_9PROT|nr:DNA polymerase III subunit beta [Acidithiobacillus ferrivorans]CDQ10435.1 DNA polymerase III, beta subunit (modular protein) [Acidithiobacillus ferrivorans]SMH64461.1 DNA polymerase III, beta subunit (modular protein) [Acidithiobacillus ferrivorans]